MKPFDDFLDLTDKDRTLKCSYHGENETLYLEGRILSEEKSHLIVGIAMLNDEIHSHTYDSSRKSLDIWYKPYYGAVAGLNYEEFNVPKDIQEINVYDIGQKVK